MSTPYLPAGQLMQSVESHEPAFVVVLPAGHAVHDVAVPPK